MKVCYITYEDSIVRPTKHCLKRFTPVILATQEAEIRRIKVQSQPRETVHETLSQKKVITKKKNWWSGSR
jgi:hypothetical protein